MTRNVKFPMTSKNLLIISFKYSANISLASKGNSKIHLWVSQSVLPLLKWNNEIIMAWIFWEISDDSLQSKYFSADSQALRFGTKFVA